MIADREQMVRARPHKAYQLCKLVFGELVGRPGIKAETAIHRTVNNENSKWSLAAYMTRKPTPLFAS